MTPYQLNMIIEEKGKLELAQTQEKIILAYLNSMWTIQWLGKKRNHPKPLNEILNIKNEKKIMTDEQMLKQVKMLNNVFGGNIN